MLSFKESMACVMPAYVSGEGFGHLARHIRLVEGLWTSGAQHDVQETTPACFR